MDETFDWNRSDMLEIIINDPDDFLKIKESLTRIGIAAKNNNTLIQSVHLLHKQGKYFLVHFKEVFRLDGKHSDITYTDIERRNAIANLLEQWELCKIIKQNNYIIPSPYLKLKVISFKDKKNWNLESKVTVGKPRK